MSNGRNDPIAAADMLEKAIHPPSEYALSISTFFRPGKPLALKVFIRPEYSYLRNRVPESCAGFEIFSEVSARPSSN
jgi:hypothetical protein